MQQVTEQSSSRIPAYKLVEGALVWFQDRIMKVRRVRPATTRAGLHVHLVPADWLPIGGPLAQRHEAAALVRVPCGINTPWELVSEVELQPQQELATELEQQAEEVASTCKGCLWFSAGQIEGVGTCTEKFSRVMACDRACQAYQRQSF